MRRPFGSLVPFDVAGALRTAPPVGRAASSPAPSSLPNVLSQMGDQLEAFWSDHAGRSIANPDAPMYNFGPPWIDPPPGWQEFYTPGIIPTPAPGVGDTVCLVLPVPNGWRGVIKRVSNWYSGAFVNGSGDLIWRLFRNGRPFKNFDAMTIMLGTPSQPFSFERGGLALESGDTITATVANVAGVAPGTQSAWFLGGYLYPITGA